MVSKSISALGVCVGLLPFLGVALANHTPSVSSTGTIAELRGADCTDWFTHVTTPCDPSCGENKFWGRVQLTLGGARQVIYLNQPCANGTPVCDTWSMRVGSDCSDPLE